MQTKTNINNIFERLLIEILIEQLKFQNLKHPLKKQKKLEPGLELSARAILYYERELTQELIISYLDRKRISRLE